MWVKKEINQHLCLEPKGVDSVLFVLLIFLLVCKSKVILIVEKR